MHTLRQSGLLGLAVMLLQSSGMLDARQAAAGECYEQAPLRPVYRTFVRRDVVEPGVYEVTRVPSQYGIIKRKVIDPQDIVWHEEPAVYRTMKKRVRVSGGWACARRDSEGRKIMCRAPDRYETVEKKVLVRPEQRWYSYTPKTVYVHERILLRPYRNIAHYHRPGIDRYRERVKIYPEGYWWKPTNLRPKC